MSKRNTHLAKLHQSYLFAEIARRKQLFLEKNPDADLISLGIGDTTEPIPKIISQAMAAAALDLGTRERYVGYDPGFGNWRLREKIAEVIYKNIISPEEIFITDGSKPDIGRLQSLFSQDARIAVQDPSYPAYIAGSVIAGKTGTYDPQKKQYDNLITLSCTKETDFFPDLSKTPRTDLIFFCSPNNPTGIAANRKQLNQLIEFAKSNQSIILFDSAYSAYIQDQNLPKSIYEIEGSRSVAIETGSFSKSIGFTGVRLGWTVVPKELSFCDGTPVIEDWKQVMTTYFNGASYIAQMGGIAALSENGIEESQKTIRFYLENSSLLKEAMLRKGVQVFGGDHAPYLWVHLPKTSSWETFDRLLHNAHLITTPGSGFGPGGEEYIRISAYGNREQILASSERLTRFL